VPIEIALPGQTESDALAVVGGEGARIVDEKLGGRVARLRESREFRNERAEALLLHADGDLQAPRVILAGVGDDPTVEDLRTAGAAVAQALARVGGTVTWLLDESLDVPLPEQAAALVEGTVLGGYSPGAWKTQEPGTRPKPIEKIVIGHFESDELRAAAERAALLAERTNRARDLANMPPNELNPHTLGEHAKELAHEHEHLTCEVLGTRELDELGMGALTAVGRGSRNEPRLVVLRYDPPNAKGDVVLGLVGKSNTFDTGGISLTPGAKMEDMKGDMAGGAGTVPGIGAYAPLKLRDRASDVLGAELSVAR
jgi:leucyl aminopeptidase